MEDTSGATYFLLVLAVIIFALAVIILLETKKHEFPRTVLFFYCSLPFALGAGMLILTYMDFTQDVVHPIFFKTGLTPVKKFGSPTLFFVGLIFNVFVYLAILAAALVGMFRAITDTKFRFKE